MKRFSLLLSVAVAVTACSDADPGRIPVADDPADVTVSRPVRAAAAESFPASVEAERSAEVATRMSGTVEAVLVDVGDRVARGQALVRLDASDVRARVAAAEAARELAERSHHRVAALEADGAASRAELDEATARLESARAAVREARAQEAYAEVRAPFSGEVTARSVDPGDLAVPGRPLLSLVGSGALKVTAELPAHRAGSLRAGSSVRVRIADRAAPLDAEVTRVVNALGAGARTFRVEARIADPPSSLLPGSWARLELPRDGEGARWLPTDAVVRRGQLRGVWAVADDTVRLRWVRLGRETGQAVELLGGPAGDLVVVRRPGADLHDGRPVGSLASEPFDPSVGGGAR